MNAPELSRRDLEASIRRRIESREGRYLMAVHGRSPNNEDDVLDLDGTRVRLVSVRSELDLRRKLLDVTRDEYAVFLIPWRAPTLPIDLCGRFKGNGRISLVGREERLKARFDVTEVDVDARDAPLAEYILAHHPTETFGIVGGRLTLDALWTSWLARVWKLDTGGELALDALLGWAAIDPRGPQFVTTMGADEMGQKVRGALHDYLRKKLGYGAVEIWEGWETGRGAAVLEYALVLGALDQSQAAMTWTLMTAEQVFGKTIGTSEIKRLGETADPAVRFLLRPGQSNAAAVRTLVRDADKRAQHPVIADHVGGSLRLPSAWRARLDLLGHRLSEVAANPTATTVQAAVDASRAVWFHEMAKDKDQAPVLRRIEMALRLASWLAVRPDKELPPSVTPYDDVENIAGWYAREGGYLDRARRWARGGGDGSFADGVAAVVAAVDTIRVELDLRFARALPHWHVARRRATQVVPIDQAVQRIGTAFLDEDPTRKLLVILMDGMAWAQAVELLESMGNRASVWGPLAWHGIHRIGDAPYPAVLTNFPTITEVSRSAFFGGKSIPPGAPTDSSRDVEKWSANRDVQKHIVGNSKPQLRLRGEVQTRDGSAAPDALDLVLDTQQKIVAVVLNAIDMSLKADRTHEVEWKLDTVRALRDLLDKAMEAKRAVLLCSDHGHVLSDRMVGLGKQDALSARHRTWHKESDPLAEYEIGLPAGDGVWAPKGAHGVVMIADDAHRYGGGTGSGEHGGASLAEVVAPCVLIGCADVPAATEDPGQAVRPTLAPSWWFFDVPEVEEAIVEEPTKKPRRPTKKTPGTQTAFVEFTPPTTPVVAVPRTLTPIKTANPLATSELFLACAPNESLRTQALRAVDFLRVRKGVASAAAFGAELDVFAARVPGVVSNLQGILNVDGYQVLRFDKVNQQVILDLAKLAQQFDVKL